jgi:hypothetical protein
MANHTQLDFQLLLSLGSSSMLVSLRAPLRDDIKSLPECWARAHAALRFCWYVSQDAQQLHTEEPHATRLREAFLRACLAEYRAMDEVLPRDLTALGIQTPSLKIHDLKNPLLHLMKELRNFEIHLASSALNSATIDVVVRWDDNEIEHQRTIWVTEPLTVTKFKQLKNARHYADADIKAMVDWFNNAQQYWGVHHLAFLATTTFCQELVTHYGLASGRDT